MFFWIAGLVVFCLYLSACRSHTNSFLWDVIIARVRETSDGELFRDTQHILDLLMGHDYFEIKRLKESEEKWRLASENLRSIILTAHLGIRRDKRIKVFSLDKW